jgi:ABC-type Na+ efflux pump permease subunit
MSWRAMRAVLRKELLHIYRDGQTWVLVIFTPAILLVMFAYLFSFDAEDFSICLLDQDITASSRDYVQMLASDGILHVERVLSGWDEIEQIMLMGEADAVVVIPPAFERNLLSGAPAPVQVVVDGSDPATASQALAQISTRSASYSQAILLRSSPTSAATAGLFAVRDTIWYNPALRSLFSMVPGLLAVVLVMPAFSAAQSIAKEKELGTLESLLATPIGRFEMIIGKGLPYVVTGLIGVALTAAVAILWFRVPFRGHFLLFLVLGLDFLFASNFIALMVSNIVQSQQAAMIAMFILFFLPGFFLTGLFDPLESAGLGARIEGAMQPATYFITISRGIFLKGVDLSHLWKPAISLLGLGLGGLILAAATFKSRLT